MENCGLRVRRELSLIRMIYLKIRVKSFNGTLNVCEFSLHVKGNTQLHKATHE